MPALNYDIEKQINKKTELNIIWLKQKTGTLSFILPEEYFYIVLIKKGEGKVIRNFQDYEFKQNSIMIVNGKDSVLYKIEKSQNIEISIIVFNEHILACPEAHVRIKDLPALQFYNNEESFVITGKDEAEFLLQSIKKIELEITGGNRWNWNLIRLYFTEMLIYFSRIIISKYSNSDSKYDEIIEGFFSLIDRHYTEHHLINFYSDKLNISANALAKKIKAASGKTFQTVVNDRIAIEAMRKLFNTNKSVKEIAYDLGYEDPSYFHRFFKKLTGRTPQEFRSYALKKYT